jgi:hypothetical protein
MTKHTQNPPKPAPVKTMHHRMWPLALAVLTLSAFSPVHAADPATSPATPPAQCNDEVPMPVEQLVGLWQLSLWPDKASRDEADSQGAVLFEPHPEYPGSVRGRLKRTGPGNDLQALLSGDVVNGEFNLDESDDGVRMSATWVGTPFDCGTRLRGVREPAEAMNDTGTALQFELRKAAD